MTGSSTYATEIPAEVPEWIHLLPSGEFMGRDGRGPFFVDGPAVLARTRTYHQGKDMVVDYDHQTVHTLTNGAGAPAAGWVKELEARATGIWGRVEWTPAARAKIANREYRYISPAIPTAPASNTGLMTVSHIAHIGLVNHPNLCLTALNAAGHPDQGDLSMTLKSQIADALGLAPDASDEAILNSLRGRLGATADPRKYVPVEDVQAMMRDMGSKISTHTAAETERRVNEAMAAGRLPPALKGWGLQLCSADPAAFETFVANAPVIVTPGISYAHMAAAPTPSGRAEGGTPEERVLARELGVSVEDLRKGR